MCVCNAPGFIPYRHPSVISSNGKGVAKGATVSVYVVVDAHTRELHRFDTDRDRLGKVSSNQTILTLKEMDVVPSGYEWDPKRETFLPARSHETVTTLLVWDFLGRFSMTERMRLQRALSEHPDEDVRTCLQLIMWDWQNAPQQTIDRASSRIQEGIAYLAGVTFGKTPLLDPLRVAEIIGADALTVVE